jgi:hypothetical protein
VSPIDQPAEWRRSSASAMSSPESHCTMISLPQAERNEALPFLPSWRSNYRVSMWLLASECGVLQTGRIALKYDLAEVSEMFGVLFARFWSVRSEVQILSPRLPAGLTQARAGMAVPYTGLRTPSCPLTRLSGIFLGKCLWMVVSWHVLPSPGRAGVPGALTSAVSVTGSWSPVPRTPRPACKPRRP